jgi:hypothetical protein
MHGHARIPPLIFIGWARVKAADLRRECDKEAYEIHASPIDQPARNDYHAHIVPPPGLSGLHAALFLKWTFGEYGSMQYAQSSPGLEGAGQSGLQNVGYFRNVLLKIAKLLNFR